MKLKAEDKPLLPAHRAFVVQFRAETDLEQGRVEHVVSGQATHFYSLKELLTFMGQVLTEVSAQREGSIVNTCKE